MAAILFVCVGNSARSQLAEAIARHLDPTVEAWSAGSRPASVHPLVREVLREEGIDDYGLRSKSFLEVPLDEVDLVVSLCAEEQVPLLPTRLERVGWPLPDPASAPRDKAVEAFRATRDELMRRLPGLLASRGRP